MLADFQFDESPLQRWESLGEDLGCELFVKRDDLLPFPLAGNKFRKLAAEGAAANWGRGDLLITNGAIESNHCRTLAFMAARLGATAHLVLHGSEADAPPQALAILRALGATCEVVDAAAIKPTIERRASEGRSAGQTVHVIPGGAHTPAGVQAYKEATLDVLAKLRVDHIVLASGTGATHAGIVLGAGATHSLTQVTGISVARGAVRGREAVVEALSWVDPLFDEPVAFDDRFIDGGYAQYGAETAEAVARAWKRGLPLDTTYTGKAMRGLIHKLRLGEIRAGSSVLFWHTGGLANAFASLNSVKF